MSPKRQFPLLLEPAEIDDLKWFAAEFDTTVADVARAGLPSLGVMDMALTCRAHDPGLSWSEVAEVGNHAIREFLRERFTELTNQHFARLGVEPGAANVKNLEAAIADARNTLHSEENTPIDYRQLKQADEDVIYLGRLIEAYRNAKAGDLRYQFVNRSPGGTSSEWTLTHNGRAV